MADDTAPARQGNIEDLARAQGKLVLFLASLLERAGIVRAVEFADLLSVFAETVSETDPGEGTILQAWAQAVAGVRERPLLDS